MNGKPRISDRANAIPNWRDLLHNPLAEASRGIQDMLLTGGGEWSTDIEMPEHLIMAAQEAVRSRPQYTHEYGLMALRESIARKLAEENGIHADPETEVVVTNSATEAICDTILALVNPGDEVILGNPYYLAIYQPNLALAGARATHVRTSPEQHFRISPEAIEGAVSSRTKLIVLTTPDNPTGAVLPRESLQEIAAIAERHDLLILADEMYEKFVYDGRKHVSIASMPEAYERTITVNGFSKTYGLTGYRIGFFAGPGDLVRHIAKVRFATSICANEVSQRVSLAALDGPQGWLMPIVHAYEQSRDLFVGGLKQVEGVEIAPPDGAIYVFPDVRRFGVSSLEMSTYLIREARVANRPGNYFGDAGEGHVRFNITPTLETAREAVRRVQEALGRFSEASRAA